MNEFVKINKSDFRVKEIDLLANRLKKVRMDAVKFVSANIEQEEEEQKREELKTAKRQVE